MQFKNKLKLVKSCYEKFLILAKPFLIWAQTNWKSPIYSLQNQMFYNRRREVDMTDFFGRYRIFFVLYQVNFAEVLAFSCVSFLTLESFLDKPQWIAGVFFYYKTKETCNENCNQHLIQDLL